MKKILPIALLAALSALAACEVETRAAGDHAASGKPAAAAKKTGEVVANVGDDTITVDEFKAKMEEQSPFIRARYTTLERKKEFLDNLVRFEVLAQEARRRGLEQDPEVQATMKKVMVQKLIRAEFDDNEAAKNVPEADLTKYYEEHLDDYKKPERVRISHVFLAAAAGDASRAKVKSEAAKLLADVKGKEAGTQKTALTEAAKARSDDAATKPTGGDLTFKTKEELAAAWGTAVADAAFSLKTIGEIGSLVETEKGFHLVKLTGRQNALDRPYESVKSQIQNRLFRERRTKAFDDFVADLKTKADVKVKDEVLEKIDVVPGNAPVAGSPSGGLPPGNMALPANHPAVDDHGGHSDAPKAITPGGQTIKIPSGGLKPPAAALPKAAGK